jgi:exodeoxyribonuclease VII large subunit
MTNPKGLSLSELNRQIAVAIRNSFPADLWVIGEISEMKVSTSGHCYLEIIEKDPGADAIIARQKANIWAYSYRMLSEYFRSTTGYQLSAGLKILIFVQVEFHEVYGISLTVKDIDPSYTLGEFARKKREIILQLEKEGVIDMNRNLPFPAVPQRIAVISSPTAAGWGDFQDSLLNNPYGFVFQVELFQAYMQGEKAEASIINALDRVFEREKEFDLVVMIRGGGATSDMECFNNYNLVYHITQFPLPVVTGIGHEKDESIADIVACRSLKTPTAVAEFLIDSVTAFYEMILSFQERLADAMQYRVLHETHRLSGYSQRLSIVVMKVLHNQFSRMHAFHQNLIHTLREFINRRTENLRYFIYRTKLHSAYSLKLLFTRIRDLESLTRQKIRKSLAIHQDHLSAYEKNLNYLNPADVLRRGYTITTFQGKMITEPGALAPGDRITTKFYKGSVDSGIIKTNPSVAGSKAENDT